MLNRKVWRIKNTWPGSPPKGTVISNAMHEYVTFKPQENAHLFEELNLDVTFTSEDCITLFPGDRYYFIDTYNWKIQSYVLSDPSYLITQKYKIWSTEELAQKELDSLIELETEDGLIFGYNMQLFGCCISQSPFQLSENTSLGLWQKKMKRPNATVNPNWKWFKSEESREDYMSSIELKWTKKDLRDVLEKCGCLKHDITFSDINSLLNEITQMSK
jgi:hypothetical protein